MAGGVAQLDATDRSDLDPTGGVWMLLAHHVEASDPNDPNTVQKSLRAAVWSGGKFDWNGQYDLDYTYASGPNVTLPAGLIHAAGLCGFATFGFPNWTSPVLSRKTDVSFDDVECRRGSFTNQSATLSLVVLNAGMGTIDVEPNLPDPNDPDPNMPYTMRYTLGTSVVLRATPNPGKEFNYWQILDPNYPGDPDYGTFDSNTTLRLTMTQDTEVIAAFKCASGLGMGSLLAVFQVLALWVVWRRRGS
jgi:hypothetical protein